MVMQIHTGEFEYIGSNGVIHSDGAWAVGWINSLFRSCVPLFVMISGFFLFSVGDERVFFRKRFTRVLTPFIVWCIVYAFYYYAQGQASLATTFVNIAKIPVNYGTDVGHLWFVYMLMGIYLMAPVLSPWVVSACRGSMQLFLVLWAVASSVSTGWWLRSTVVPQSRRVTLGQMGRGPQREASALRLRCSGYTGSGEPISQRKGLRPERDS
jgi:surface polysaccharide O-acyltransferase-like enzyme